MPIVADFKERIDELAQLMDEFHLAEARLESDGQTVAFRRRSAQRVTSNVVEASFDQEILDYGNAPQAMPVAEPVVAGTPVTSPMTGIFYDAPSPGSAPFVKEGDTVTAGQVIGLIEAMKVFNEIPSTASGTVVKLVAEGGNVVQTGETLIVVS